MDLPTKACIFRKGMLRKFADLKSPLSGMHHSGSLIMSQARTPLILLYLHGSSMIYEDSAMPVQQQEDTHLPLTKRPQ